MAVLTLGGSIPARAGEPRCSVAPYVAAWVYPRACGGTDPIPVLSRLWSGLSPRVRGNLDPRPPKDIQQGSIPARAGEPCPAPRSAAGGSVYPRACGGTTPESMEGVSIFGLSPRVRGNRSLPHRPRPAERSIPARAGEPRPPVGPVAPPGVYPRACGGTIIIEQDAPGHQGLSPRVRGNRSGCQCGRRASGSIPARAGEPRRGTVLDLVGAVYPRACGGTNTELVGPAGPGGLSPRVRGNLLVGSG